MEYFRQHVKVEYKGEADLVTVADRKSEILIRERIKSQWPSHDILGEEQGLVDTGSDYRWYVDPLDGTTNFAHGFPVFCVSLGLEHKNRRIAGVVYDPTRDELFAAEQGSGAFLEPAWRMQVSKIAAISESLVATGFPSHKAPQESQHSLLSSDYLTHPWRTPGRFRGVGLVLCGERTFPMRFGSSISIRGTRRPAC